MATAFQEIIAEGGSMVKSIRARIKGRNIKRNIQVVQPDEQWVKISQQIIKLYQQKTQQQEKTFKYLNSGWKFLLEMQQKQKDWILNTLV